MTFSEFNESDFDQFFLMSRQLWKDIEQEKLKRLLKEAIQSEKTKIIIAHDTDAGAVGFAIFSIRNDYVEGAEKSPTGYLEGIFVEEAFRKSGIAREFLKIGEAWCKEKGCTQLGSDTWLTDTASREFHKRVGFWEEEEVVHFLKNIK